MKITQEVRDFAAKQSSPAFAGEGDHPQGGGGAAPALAGAESAETFLAAEDAEQGMAEMSERFRKEGGEIYLPATESF